MTPLNGPIDLLVRALALLVEAHPAGLEMNQLVLMDHALVHSGDLGGPPSLHPPMPIRAAELGVKRETLHDALAILVRTELASVRTGQAGILFYAEEAAHPFLELLSGTYAAGLRVRAMWVVSEFQGLSEAGLRSMVSTVQGRWSEEFQTNSQGVPR